MRGPGRARTILIMVAATAVVLGLGGCGRQGGLEPAPDVSAPTAGPNDPGLPTMRRPKVVPITPPRDPFILDPLL